ncbi:hypothetical protein OS493_007704 [Desmophyllum pertusum]|uniref:Uncharacterized protein n=1 Tax=Desmophyllum pertusum TaxID=174260 RepID=A0A9W9YRM0_9CNID|nr:hypothetical protein OS493_007704 [Desmophyllum pertusum]
MNTVPVDGLSPGSNRQPLYAKFLKAIELLFSDEVVVETERIASQSMSIQIPSRDYCFQKPNPSNSQTPASSVFSIARLFDVTVLMNPNDVQVHSARV